MKNPAYEQIQARKVKARLRMLQPALRLNGNVSQTCRFFGVSRTLFYNWKQRYEKHGIAGLRDMSRRPHNIRFRIPLCNRMSARIPMQPVEENLASTQTKSGAAFVNRGWVRCAI